MTESLNVVETKGCCCGGCGDDKKAVEVDEQFHLSHDVKFGTLLMLLPAVTLSFFSVAGLL